MVLKRRLIGVIVLLLAATIGAGLLTRVVFPPQKSPTTTANGEVLSLPSPQITGGMPLTEALARRRSHREFADQPLTRQQVSQLCWAAQGVSDETRGLRTAPSAGALYPLTVFVIDEHGAYEYEPERHALRTVAAGDLRSELQAAALNQPAVGNAPVCVVIAMNVSRTAAKYKDRAERYCLLEAGHVAQNVLLQATALGLTGVPMGGFEPRRVAKVLDLAANLEPVYLIPLGHTGQT
jgi:SagB-type dehydrogenase family enzyme